MEALVTGPARSQPQRPLWTLSARILSIIGVAMTLLDKRQLRPLLYPALTRLGPRGDGGYVVPADQIPYCRFLISLGLCDNWKFDKDFLELNPAVSIVGVDHSVGQAFFISGIPFCLFKILGYALLFNRAKLAKYTNRLHDYVEYFSFFRDPHKHLRKRVLTASSGARDITLNAILNTSAPGSGHDVFVKMDIEGSEYEIIPDIAKNHPRIRCLVAEFHRLHKRTEEFNQAVRALARHFSIVHVHGNNIGPYDETIDFPITVETTWVNKDLIKDELGPSTMSYPREGLDSPNTPTKPDYKLSF